MESLSLKVYKHPITLSLEDCFEVCYPPFMEQESDHKDLEGNKFDFKIHSH